MKWWIGFIALVSIHLVAVDVLAKTPEECTPAAEEVCDQYKGEGARYGLCIAYCEAHDCDSVKPGTDGSCDQLAENFADYSLKQGFKDTTISCRTGGCTKDDIAFCGGEEMLCLEGDGCVARCTLVWDGTQCLKAKPCKECEIKR